MEDELGEELVVRVPRVEEVLGGRRREQLAVRDAAENARARGRRDARVHVLRTRTRLAVLREADLRDGRRKAKRAQLQMTSSSDRFQSEE